MSAGKAALYAIIAPAALLSVPVLVIHFCTSGPTPVPLSYGRLGALFGLVVVGGFLLLYDPPPKRQRPAPLPKRKRQAPRGAGSAPKVRPEDPTKRSRPPR